MKVSYYTAGVGSLFDDQLKRLEALEAKAAKDAGPLADKVASSVDRLKGAVIGGAVVTGVSTAVLVAAALRVSRGRR